MYCEMPKDALEPHDTWVIGFCPDTDSFFATNQRAFYWESLQEFDTEQDAIKFFEKHTSEFIDLDNELMKGMMYGDLRGHEGAFLENTNKEYFI